MFAAAGLAGCTTNVLLYPLEVRLLPRGHPSYSMAMPVQIPYDCAPTHAAETALTQQLFRSFQTLPQVVRTRLTTDTAGLYSGVADAFRKVHLMAAQRRSCVFHTTHIVKCRIQFPVLH